MILGKRRRHEVREVPAADVDRRNRAMSHVIRAADGLEVLVVRAGKTEIAVEGYAERSVGNQARGPEIGHMQQLFLHGLYPADRVIAARVQIEVHGWKRWRGVPAANGADEGSLAAHELAP